MHYASVLPLRNPGEQEERGTRKSHLLALGAFHCIVMGYRKTSDPFILIDKVYLIQGNWLKTA